MDDSPKMVVEKYLQFMYEGENTLSAKTETVEEKNGNIQVDTSGFVLVGEHVRQFGNRRAVIEGVKLVSGGQTNSMIYTDRSCDILIRLRCHEKIQQPIIGFIIKDRLGRNILSDNTSLISDSNLPSFGENRGYLVTFSIKSWPNLMEDDYSLSIAVADGLVKEHEQCHFIHDIIVFRSIPTRKSMALISVPDTTVSYAPIGY